MWRSSKSERLRPKSSNTDTSIRRGAIITIDDNGSVLIYSTDGGQVPKCPRCKRLIPECQCLREEPKSALKTKVLLKIETAGRDGKIVSVIEKLPRSEKYLRELASKLKTRCGSGGTYAVGPEGGRIEIQGDKREMIRKLLEDEGIRVKG